MVLAAPCFLTAGVLFELEGEAHAWPGVERRAFACATVITLASMAWLRRSFSILPAVRRIVARGPCRWVRHPVYVGKLISMAACVL